MNEQEGEKEWYVNVKEWCTCYGEIWTAYEHFRGISRTSNGRRSKVRRYRCGSLVGKCTSGRVWVLHHGHLKIESEKGRRGNEIR